VTVREAAERLDCSAATVYALVAQRHLRASRVGLKRGKIFISEEAVQEYLQAREVGPIPASPAPRVARLEHLRLS
jgi:excisionase family DNA binding protein